MRAVLVLFTVILTFFLTSGLWTSVSSNQLHRAFTVSNIKSNLEPFEVNELKKNQPLWNWLFAKELITREVLKEPLVKTAKITPCNTWSCYQLDVEYIKPAFLVTKDNVNWLISDSAEFIAPVENRTEITQMFGDLVQINTGNANDANLINLQIKASIELIHSLEDSTLHPKQLAWQDRSVSLQMADWPTQLVLSDEIARSHDRKSIQEQLVTRIDKLNKYIIGLEQQQVLVENSDSTPSVLIPEKIDLRYQGQAILSFKS